MWMYYAFSEKDLLLGTSSSLYAGAGALLVGAIVWQKGNMKDWPLVVLWGGILAGALMLNTTNSAAVGVVLVSGAAAWSGPQVIQAWKNKDTRGISVVSWLVTGVDAVVWMAYGLVAGLTALALWGVVTASASVSIIAGTQKYRWRKPCKEKREKLASGDNAGDESKSLPRRQDEKQ